MTRSFFQCYDDIICSEELSAEEKLVLMVLLAVKKNSKHHPSLSYEEIAKKASLKRTKTYQGIKGLEKKKFIKIIQTSFKRRSKYMIQKKALVSSSACELQKDFSSSGNSNPVVQHAHSKYNNTYNKKTIEKKGNKSEPTLMKDVFKRIMEGK
jgi:DNA-binding Lrp family transcriptional regulator